MTSTNQDANQKSKQLDCIFAATILKRGSRVIAAEATGRLLEALPTATAGFGPDPFAAWQNWLAARVEELAAAIGLNRPSLFVEQTQWACSALGARGIAPAAFRFSLECLSKAVEAELPQRVRALTIEPIVSAVLALPTDQVLTAGAWSTSALSTNEPFGRLASEYLLAVLEGDIRHAREMIISAVDDGVSIRDLYMRVLCPAQTEVGRMWFNNEITIADEHLCSATTRRMMGQLVQLARVEPPNGKTVVTAAVAGNRHEIGQQTVADFFEIDGWRTLQLGADVPAGPLVEVIETTSVDLLALSAALAVQLPVLRDTIAMVRESSHARLLKIIVGGRAFQRSADLAAELGADAYAADAEQAVVISRRLLGLEK